MLTSDENELFPDKFREVVLDAADAARKPFGKRRLRRPAMVFISGIITQNRVHGFCSERHGLFQNKLWQNRAVNISPWGKRLHFFFLPARKKTKTADSLLTTRNLAVTVVLTLH